MPFYPIEPTVEQQGISTVQINPTVIFSTSGWYTTPTNLSNILDGDDSTSSTEGLAGGGSGNVGFIILDLGQEFGWLHGMFKLGIRKQDGWGNQESNWWIDYSLNNSDWQCCWGNIWKSLPSTEQIRTGNFTIKDTTRYLRFATMDASRGGAHMKVYGLRLYTLA